MIVEILILTALVVGIKLSDLRTENQMIVDILIIAALFAGIVIASSPSFYNRRRR